MLEAFIVTIWIEYNGKMYIKEADSLTRNCKAAVEQLTNKFHKSPMKLVAVKCDTAQTYKDRKEYFNDKR